MHVIILAGGFGTRLWPLSTRNVPKQFLQLFGSESLLQESLKRALAIAPAEKITVAANQIQKSRLLNEVENSGIPSKNIHFEPASKNTAPAIALAFKEILLKDPGLYETPFLICPSDHWIEPDFDAWKQVMKEAESRALDGYLVTFGIPPTYPETGFGYVTAKKNGEVEAFKEKPDLQTAQEYLKRSDTYWNSGMFIFTPKCFFDELQAQAPKLYAFFQQPLETVQANFKDLDAISLDYAVMEKAQKRALIPFPLGWSDIGSWKNLYKAFPKDRDNNAVKGEVKLFDTKGCFIFSEARPIVTAGVKDLLVVQTPSATFISDIQVDDALMRSIDVANSQERPWGRFTLLEVGECSLTKKILVDPKQRTSLQYHNHRDEHWVVVKGIARVWLGEEKLTLHPNQSIFIPKGKSHRIENQQDTTLELIEVQYGDLLSEEDIVRLEDDFDRVSL